MRPAGLLAGREWLGTERMIAEDGQGIGLEMEQIGRS